MADSWLRGLVDSLQPTTIKRVSNWPTISQYRNRETGKSYRPHNEEEWRFVTSDMPKYVLVKGGWGSGKSTAGIVKGLDRARRGCSGILVGPDNPHTERSLWMEFERWCPWDCVDYHNQTKKLVRFKSGAYLLYGGIEDPEDWEGPNVNWAGFDEARKKKDAQALKVLMSRVRVPGPATLENPQGVPPQLFIMTTPRKHWLYEYFGEIKEPVDPLREFKRESRVYTLKTEENLLNLDPGYVRTLAAGLTEAEARVNLLAEWEDLEEADRFLPSILMWDACRENLPPIRPGDRTPMVIALDAGVSDDDFGMIGVTRHPAKHEEVAVRLVQKWSAKHGKIDFVGSEEFPGPEIALRRIVKDFNVVQVCYDPYQLHDFANRLGPKGAGLAWFKEFGQGSLRLEADKQLYDNIIARSIAHDGNADLREHLDNADRLMDTDTRRLRIVKRAPSLKIDLAVALAMSNYQILRLNV